MSLRRPGTAPADDDSDTRGSPSTERAYERLEHLYEISKLFANIDNVEATIDAAVCVVARTLPLRSAILIETRGSSMIVWTSEGKTSAELRTVKDHAHAAYAYLVGGSIEALELREQAGTTIFPRQARQPSPAAEGGPEWSLARRCIGLPLAVAQSPVFGSLQLEAAVPLDKMDLMFVNAIANQLSVALDRVRSGQRNTARRHHAEEARTDAETRGVVADRRRITAELSSEKYEALAAENAKLYEEARRAVRVRDQLLAIVSHDMRTPLGTILMTTDALEEMGELPQAVGRIQRAAKTMLRLIEDLLDSASIEAGSLAIRRHPQDPGSMIRETLASFEGIAQAKALQLTAHVESQLPNVYCDSDRILQVLSNLVGNATKATAEGGEITLRAEAGAHEVVFAVSDSGPGISAEDVTHLFERYWRGERADYKGTGLGLAIASGIVSAHGGRIWAESELGRGSTFRFTIPTADETSLFADPRSDAGGPGLGLFACAHPVKRA